ncbi:hypothetical protein [Streptomyces sp. NPDC058620]|uniref:hypothetical protein n=1 Tax=Streptomyces sp. NPDC058620 TaxID=3346560 RepID=UPI003659D350
MASRIRTALTAVGSRPTAHRSPDTEFCESCSQVCDPACRSVAYRHRVELSVSLYGRTP